MEKTDALIRTKLRLPFTRAGLVSRPRLQQQVAQGLCGPLTLITAPAGFGKTTLVASCVSDCGLPVAWLSLDKNDNQPGRFLSYLVAALREANPAIGSDAAQLAGAEQAKAEAIITSLVNDLDSAGAEMVLVLDDYQFISSQSVHDELAFLLEHCPNTFHIVIATRSDPQLPLARLRARGQAVELRGADLRFTEPEAARFLNDVMGLRLDAGSVALLEERTEGWAAGLQLAALSMRDRNDVLAFIEGFSGTNRYILDYLLEEVLDRQPPDIQHFLLYTSILERLTAPLCEAVLATGDLANGERSKRESSDRAARPSAAILDYLDRANLFLVPLDEERLWYRYHHLFQDLLMQRLKSACLPEEIAEYHHRAAAWLEANDFISESIQHLLDAGDFERAGDLVEQYTLRLFAQGKLHQLLSWIGILPEALVAQRPWLCIYKAWILAFAGKPVEAQHMAGIARQAIQASSFSAEDVRGFEIELAGIHALLAISMGDAPSALAIAGLVEEHDAGDHLFACSVIHWAVGLAYRLQGSLARAIPELERVIEIGERLGNSWTILTGSVDLGLALYLSGRLREAEAIYRHCLQIIDQLGDSKSGFVGRLEFAFSGVLYQLNALDEAHRLALSSIEHNRMWDTPNHTVRGFWALAQVLIAQGELDAADQVLQKAERILAQAQVIPPVRAYLETLRARWWLVRGDREKADEWLASHLSAITSVQKPGEDIEILAIAAARVWIAGGNRTRAWELLCTIEPSARTMGRMNNLIQILALKSLTAPDLIARMENLQAALEYAQPEGYQRTFLDEGQPMQELLTQWLAHASAGPLRAYAMHLCAQFAAEPAAAGWRPITAPQSQVLSGDHPAAVEVRAPTNALAEPLSQRELEVLHLIALGKTNQEIANQFVVAKGTIKAHAANIYRKLDVANRTEAVARARQLGLLP